MPGQFIAARRPKNRATWRRGKAETLSLRASEGKKALTRRCDGE